MPVTKKPIVHKFGIISHTQRLLLQDRLLHQSYIQAVDQPTILTHRKSVEISEEFVSQYNTAKSDGDKVKFTALAYKMLEQLTRKTGVKEGGQGSDIDLPYAWTDLSVLAQCKGKIQEDCIDAFIASLEEASLTEHHLPALFYLAETVLYWLRTDVVKQPYLRAAEIKLLLMGELIFVHLFYHHMAGHMDKHVDAKKRLYTYLNGLDDCQEVYSPYPNALFSLRYMNETGMIIVSDVIIQSLQNKERVADSHVTASEQTSTSAKPAAAVPIATSDGHLSLSRETKQSISRSVHDLSPTLWHALDIWRCTHQLSAGSSEALRALSVCGKNINKENWVDGVLGLKILAEAAKKNVTVLKCLQQLAQGVARHANRQSSRTSSPQHVSDLAYDDADDKPRASLSATQEGTEKLASSDFEALFAADFRPFNPAEVTANVPNSSLAAESGNLISKDDNNANLELCKMQITMDIRQSQYTAGDVTESPTGDVTDVHMYKDESNAHCSRQGENMRESFPSKVQIDPGDKRQNQKAGLPFTGQHTCSEAGAEMSSDRAGSPPTYTNMVSDFLGLNGWHWEVAVTFANCLTDIVLHGSTSIIQKRALIGSNTDLTSCSLNMGAPMKSAGLIDLVYFKACNEASDLGHNDWSWRVRYSAVQGLVKLRRCLAGQPARDGVRTAAWTVLSHVQTHEQDARVLEALKIGQVAVSSADGLDARGVTLYNQIAARLASIYLPGLSPVVLPITPRTRIKKQPPSFKMEKKPLRTSLKDEILLATAFDKKVPDLRTRADFDLRRVVEDQWRKELQEELIEEERLRHLQWVKEVEDEMTKEIQVELMKEVQNVLTKEVRNELLKEVQDEMMKEERLIQQELDERFSDSE